MAARPYWLCRCGTRVEKPKRKCPSCLKLKPKRRVPEHARTLRDDDYETYRVVSNEIHGVLDACAICERPAGDQRLDRDHGHNRNELTFGKPRGLVCRGDNMLMPRNLTAEKARQIAAYLSRVEAHYGTAA